MAVQPADSGGGSHPRRRHQGGEETLGCHQDQSAPPRTECEKEAEQGDLPASHHLLQSSIRKSSHW